MSFDLPPNEAPTDQPGTDKGYGRDPLGQSESDCKSKAASGGGYVWDEHAQACWMLFGRAVIIGPDEMDIQEGFQLVNFNFRANGNQPAVPTQNDLPGPTNGNGPPGTLSNPMGVGKSSA